MHPNGQRSTVRVGTWSGRLSPMAAGRACAIMCSGGSSLPFDLSRREHVHLRAFA